MSANPGRLQKLEVPVIVELGRRHMKLSEVVSLLPGSIIDLEKDAESELDLLINNEIVATGTAVKVGENFGVRLSTVGAPTDRDQQGGSISIATETEEEVDADDLAAQFLAGQ